MYAWFYLMPYSSGLGNMSSTWEALPNFYIVSKEMGALTITDGLG